MSERLTCPTCGMSHREPIRGNARWTDSCVCSDAATCIAHQVRIWEAPKRPSDEVMATRNAEALVELRKTWDAKAERIRAATLTASDREALVFAKHCVEHSLCQMRMSVGGHGLLDVVKHQDAIAVFDRLLGQGGGAR